MENENSSKIKNYQDLFVWQRSNSLAIKLYKLSKGKKKSLGDWEIWRQVLRSAFSCPANIAEGFYSHRGKNFISHLEIARGSMGETDYWISVLVEIKQIEKTEGDLLRKECQEIIGMLSSLIKKIR